MVSRVSFDLNLLSSFFLSKLHLSKSKDRYILSAEMNVALRSSWSWPTNLLSLFQSSKYKHMHIHNCFEIQTVPLADFDLNPFSLFSNQSHQIWSTQLFLALIMSSWTWLWPVFFFCQAIANKFITYTPFWLSALIVTRPLTLTKTNRLIVNLQYLIEIFV